MRATSAFELNDPRGVWVQGTVLALALRPEKGGVMALAESLLLTPENGVVGDHGTSKNRQVTLLDEANWIAACEEISADLPWTARRANILIQGLDLPKLVEQQVRVGTALVEVIGEVDPCYVMDAAQNGLKAALKPDWRGGVYARVIESGQVSTDDNILLIHSSQ
jgi:MOSC domain-containing protein YiiM